MLNNSTAGVDKFNNRVYPNSINQIPSSEKWVSLNIFSIGKA
jgi:hypothetical protein